MLRCRRHVRARTHSKKNKNQILNSTMLHCVCFFLYSIFVIFSVKIQRILLLVIRLTGAGKSCAVFKMGKPKKWFFICENEVPQHHSTRANKEEKKKKLVIHVTFIFLRHFHTRFIARILCRQLCFIFYRNIHPIAEPWLLFFFLLCVCANAT